MIVAMYHCFRCVVFNWAERRHVHNKTKNLSPALGSEYEPKTFEFIPDKQAQRTMVTLERSRRWVEDSLHCQGNRNCKPYIEFRNITLKEPALDPEWLFQHPRFRRGTNAAESFPKIGSSFLKSTKKIPSRVPSARGNARDTSCERRVRNQSNSTGRYFCELLGPNLCKDCWKLTERSEAISTHRVSSSANKRQNGEDSFSAVIASREKEIVHSEREEEIFDETEDEEWIFKTPTQSRKRISSSPSYDIDYASRVSYMQDLCRTPSGNFYRRIKSSPSKHDRSLSNDEVHKNISSKTYDCSLSQESRPIWKNSYLMRLREREPFKEVFNSLYLPRKLRHAWRELPVGPVLMDLKLINFTIYDGSPLNARETDQKCWEDVKITTDNGFFYRFHKQSQEDWTV